jgi:hypothetical protein
VCSSDLHPEDDQGLHCLGEGSGGRGEGVTPLARQLRSIEQEHAASDYLYQQHQDPVLLQQHCQFF